MPQTPRALEHQDADKKTDEALRHEARAHLADAPALQLVADLHGKLRSLDLPWWTPEALRARWSATDRMRWYRARADLRQLVTTGLSGLSPRAARKKTPEFQGALIDSAIDEGDVTVRAFEDSFDPADLVVYGPAEDLWRAFIERLPWGEDSPVHQELCAWLLDALLADHSAVGDFFRKPILTAWEARTAIDGRVWHTRVPLEIRVAIDEARFDKERQRPTEPFHAESDLSIAVSATLAASIPLRDLAPVFAAAERQMGFTRPRRDKPAEPPPARPASIAPPPVASPASIAPPPASIAPPPARPAPVPSQPPPAMFAPVAVPPKPPPSDAGAASKPAAPAPAAKSKSEAEAGAKAPPPARAPAITLPDVLHTISGEEERTNPWDIPAEGEEPAPDDGEAKRRAGKG
jgi:hypothetical protein